MPIKDTRLVAMLASLVACTAATAQTQPRTTSAPPRTAGIAVDLADAPFNFDEVGLSMYLPRNATAQSTMIGDRKAVQIVPDDQKWVINIQTPASPRLETTIKEAADNTWTLIQGAYGVLDKDQKVILETKATLIDRVSNLRLNSGAVCERIYTSVPRQDGSRLVKGYSIFKPAADTFVVFELITDESLMSIARPIYEASIATASFLDPEMLNASRGSLVKAGVAFFAGLTDADYAAAFADGREFVHRLSMPSRTGSAADAQELGFRRMRFWKGKRADVGGVSSTRSGSQEGYLARIQARMLFDERVIDSEATYFMSLDRNEETWTLRTVVWGPKGERLGSAVETGGRIGRDLNIVIQDGGKSPEELRPFVPAEGYLSQFELFLLHRLLVTRRIQTELAFYTYQSQSRSVSLRRDFPQTVGSGGNWDVVTTFRDEATPQRYSYDASGTLIRSVLDDGSTWEAIDSDNLQRMWQRKGLPTGAIGRSR
ncbi:MAG: hypothetical protein KF699_12800 [Phycisphaeraceae bacterium]|nr:hypothetical protein [Phycisphaeraceae bacterium]MBX3405745.1 hypothetical protein [Phycisphaeraceae bacterium]